MSEPDQQTQNRAMVQLPDFDLDTYQQLFQDFPHSASSSLELDCFTNYDELSPSSSGSHSSGQPNPQSSLVSDPSWSPLDQLFLASLPHHPQSSPLFPLDLIPNQPSAIEPIHDNQLNNHFSLDAHLHDWNQLSFDPASLTTDIPFIEYQPPLRSSSENDHQSTQPVSKQEIFSSEQYLKDHNRPSIEGQEYGDFLHSPINVAPTIFDTSPPPRPATPYTPILPMKRIRSSYSQLEDQASPLGTVDLSSITCNNSIAVEQLIQSDKEAIPHSHSLEPKPKRSKTRPTISSASKNHICQECGKSFPRLTSLTQHKLTHNGERPFPCGYEGCSKSFTTSSNMKRHWKTHV